MARKKVKLQCKNCGWVWAATPNNMQRKCWGGCPRCKSSVRWNDDLFKKEMLKINSAIKIIGKYTSGKQNIEVECNVCGHRWSPIGESLLRGHGCPRCAVEEAGRARLKTDEQFRKELSVITNTITPIEQYIGQYKNIKFKCLICGNIWCATPKNVLHGTGCPACSMSKGERRIASVLDTLRIYYIPQYKFPDCKTSRVLPFDFYLPDYRICIEYDGIQHFEPVEYFGGTDSFFNLVKKDQIKDDYCKNNNINLIRIAYYDYDIIPDIIADIADSHEWGCAV